LPKFSFPKLKALRWWIIGLVMLGAMLNYLTRSVMGVAAPTMLTELHISEQQYGWITSRLPGRDHAAAVLSAMSSTRSA
jgi:ACS family hexuronate transporter-like MFS transporter